MGLYPSATCYEGWCREKIASYSKGLNPTEQAWIIFEREYCGLKDALKAVEPLTKGFPIIVYTDHKNNLFSSALLDNRRMAKKVSTWAIELQHFNLTKVCDSYLE